MIVIYIILKINVNIYSIWDIQNEKNYIEILYLGTKETHLQIVIYLRTKRVIQKGETKLHDWSHEHQHI